jgi:hypothetical protein
MSSVPQLSACAWAQLDQFRRSHSGLVWAGDLIDKEGKRELMQHGLVSGQDGDYYLTAEGRELAARMGPDGWSKRTAKN